MQSVEQILLGYNTPTHLPWVQVYVHLANVYNYLSGAYQNSTWVVGIAKAGNAEGCADNRASDKTLTKTNA